VLIEEFAWDDLNEAKVSAHGLTPEEVDEVLESRMAVRRNKGQRRGTHKIHGRTLGGREVTIIIEPTAEATVWRPVTGWPGWS
jgi:hypothetical protein